MAKFQGSNTDKIYKAAGKWRDSCLIKSGSILWDGEQVWTVEILKEFKKQFIDRPDEAAEKNFGTKFQEQLQGSSPGVYQLAAELLFVHFLFTNSLRGSTKKHWIQTVVEWGKLKVEDSLPELAVMDGGIGGTGESYNIRRWRELATIALFALDIIQKKPEVRATILSSHEQVRDAFDDTNEMGGTQTPHIILHLLFPEQYERIASANQKRAIVSAFDSLLDDTDGENVDDLLFSLRGKLQQMLNVQPETLDFYHNPLAQVWWTPSSPPQDLDPVSGLKNKKQIVFYGPPGTGKTYEANQIAKTVIRQEVLKRWGAAKFFKDLGQIDELFKERIRRVQFHPGYGYEEFVRGLQLGDNGKTEYRNGVLLDILDNMSANRQEHVGIPFVLILDEMNRADLSRVLGECFSLLENRGISTTLAGYEGKVVTLPEDLYIIGTMNLIDQSLEQVDFALRRRFLWFPKDYSQDDFVKICRYRWEKLIENGEIAKKWSFDYLSDQFDILAERATKLNSMIAQFHDLGKQYEIGHTYFSDIVDFVKMSIAARKQKGRVLFNGRGEWKEPVQQLWVHSLKPLLDQYLSGVEDGERSSFIRQLQVALESGKEA